MGLFSFAKKQLLKVIEWKDSSKTTMVYRYPLTDRDEIMNSSTLVVRPSQMAVFVHKGEIADVFGPGTYTLATENIPILTKLLSLPTGMESKIKAEVYFLNATQFTSNKWGTQNPAMMRDKEFGMIRLRAFGTYGFKISDARMFMKELFGTSELYTVEDISNHIKATLVQCVVDTVAESNIAALELAANYKEFATKIKENAQPEFAKLGLKLCDFIIENISLPEGVEKALDERTKLATVEDKLDTFNKYQAGQAMREAANNQSGGNFAGIGVGLGAGTMMGEVFGQSLKAKEETKTCDKCGAQVKANAKFCGECGQRFGKVCVKCGHALAKNARFCAECGAKQVKVCAKCGAELKPSTKFCGECGEKV